MEPKPKNYFGKTPAVPPKGFVVVHNHIHPRPQPDDESYDKGLEWREIGEGGFRAWKERPACARRIYTECSCGWAPHLGGHYRIRLTPEWRAKWLIDKFRYLRATTKQSPGCTRKMTGEAATGGT